MIVDSLSSRVKDHLPTSVPESLAKVHFLRIDEELLVEEANLIQRFFPDHEKAASQKTHAPNFIVSEMDHVLA